MNKKAETSNNLWDTVVYVIILVLFVSSTLIFARSRTNGASLWADYYSKEISKVINLAEPGDEITLDIQKATEIAFKNQVGSLSETVQFNNAQNEVCVKLSPNQASCYDYFNNVDVINPEIKIASPINLLTFKIEEKKK